MHIIKLLNKKEGNMAQKVKKDKKEVNKSFDFVLLIIVLILLGMRNYNGAFSKLTICTFTNWK